MVYKDPDRQREANRQASQRNRKGMTNEGMTGTPDLDIRAGYDEAKIQGSTQTPSGLIPEPPVYTEAKKITKPKRGKDIKCFADLPLDVQATINTISESNEEKQKRTAAAIKYHHLFPNSYEPGVSDGNFTRLLAQAGPGHVRVSKPGDADYNGICTPEWRAERGR